MATPRNPISHYKKSLTREGGGAGRSLYISAEIIREFDLEGTEEVDVFLTDEDGTLCFVVPLDRGFDRDELVDLLEDDGFDLIHQAIDGDFWSIAAKKELTEVRADSNARVGSTLLKNVSVRGPVFEIDDAGAYADIHHLATSADLALGLDDEKQVWARLRSAEGNDLSERPHPDDVEPILEEVGTLLVHLKKDLCSLTVTASDVVNWAHKVQTVSETAAEKLDSDPKAPF